MSTGWKPAEALHGAQLHIAHGGVDARSPEESLTIKWGYTSLRGGVPHRAIQDGVEWEAVLGAGGDRLRISVDFKRTAWAQACVVLPSLAVPVGRRNGVLAPLRMGRLIRPAASKPIHFRFETFGGEMGQYSMRMSALLREGATALLHWQDPSVGFEIKSAENGALVPVLLFAESQGEVDIEFLPFHDLRRLADHYRGILKARRELKTYRAKTAERPEAEKLVGAAVFRPLCFSRFVGNTRWNEAAEEKLFVDHTFDDVRRIAEHWKNALKIDRALVLIAGWTARGYDNQHPDVLPAAARCGGDEGLRGAAKAIRSLGYLVGLHDNYNAMYPDAPSWDPAKLRLGPNGEPVQALEWAGGRPSLLCPVPAAEFARRNLPEIAARYPLNSYFLDVFYVGRLRTCHAPGHPLSLRGDMEAKRAIIDYTHSVFDVIGSEEGVEWGARDAEFFEGIFSDRAKPNRYHFWPWFEMVFHDSVQMYTHAWDRATPDRNEYITACVSYAHMPSYGVPNGRYFEQDPDEWRWGVLYRYYSPRHVRISGSAIPLDEEACAFARGDRGWGEHLCLVDRFIKNTYEVLSPLVRLCADRRATSEMWCKFSSWSVSRFYAA